ncbi:hypothetical protein DENSPDRAFT_853317 [Dentipellis sp. KUC8613]|nr:hypothetical protein DENSPDRAFT_853317 [Dentipellis sp. KUC8613]
MLVECDRCGRIHCANCIAFDVSEVALVDTYYLCYQCHIEDDRAREPEPYMGLYERKLKPDGTAFPGDPLLSKFLPIRQLPSGVPSQRVVTAPLAIIHLHLSTCVTSSTEFCSSIVKPYFYGDILKRRLLIKEIQFDFGTTKETKEYEKAVTTLIKQLNNLATNAHNKGDVRPSVAGKRALIMISTHSEEDRGDLFVEPEGSHSHEDFFNGVLPARLLSALANFEITLFFMVCGSFVSVPRSLSDLKTVIAKYQFSNVLTFTAPNLQPDLVKPFLLEFMDHVFIRGRPIGNILPRILSEIKPLFGRHTGIIHLGIKGDAASGKLDDKLQLPVFATKYLWHSPTIRPWGVFIPEQCPKCGCLWWWNFGDPSPDSINPIVVKCGGRKKLPAGTGTQPDPSSELAQQTSKKGRDRGRARREKREELKRQQPLQQVLFKDCDYKMECLPPVGGFKWVKPVSSHAGGKWMVIDA